MTYLYNEDLVAKYGVILMKIFGLERTINHMSVSELLEGKRDRRAVVFGDNTYVDKTPEPAVLVPTTPPPPPCRAYTIPSSTLGDAPQAIPCTQRTFRGIMRPSIKRVLRNNTVNTLIDVIETVAREQSEQPPVIVAAPAAPVVMPPAAVAVAATAAVPPPTTKRVTAPVIRPITARELETSQNGPCASAAVEARSPGPVQVVPVTGTPTAATATAVVAAPVVVPTQIQAELAALRTDQSPATARIRAAMEAIETARVPAAIPPAAVPGSGAQ